MPSLLKLGIDSRSGIFGQLRAAVPAPGALKRGLPNGFFRHLRDKRRDVPLMLLRREFLEPPLRAGIERNSDCLRCAPAAPLSLFHACHRSRNAEFREVDYSRRIQNAVVLTKRLAAGIGGLKYCHPKSGVETFRNALDDNRLFAADFIHQHMNAYIKELRLGTGR